MDHFNIIDNLLLALLSTQAVICLFVKYLPNHRYSHAIGVTGLLIIGIPHTALVVYILYIVSKKVRILQHLKRKCLCLLTIVCCNKHSLAEGHVGVDTDSLPDRLVNPDQYEPLIPAMNKQGIERLSK